MKIQIVVPAINLWAKYTKRCLDSIDEAMMRAKAHGIECRTVLVDNASSDETLTEAGKRVSSLFAHKRNEERWGFQKSVNYGVNDAWERGFDVVLVCNNDIVLHPEAIWRVAQRFEASRDRLVAVRKEASFVVASGDVTDYMTPESVVEETILGMVTCMDVRGEMVGKGMEPERISELFAGEKEVLGESPHPNFSAFAVNRLCWERVGEFDELFAPAYFEDNDYHYRMKLAGLLAIVCPPAMFYHYGSRTQNEAREDGKPIVTGTLFEMARNRYVGKWGGVPGSEAFQTPFNNKDRSITATKQSVV